MVVFVDLDSEDDDPIGHPLPGLLRSEPQHAYGVIHACSQCGQHDESIDVHKVIGNSNARLFASVLACYPASSSIAAELDLNDLYSLSRTCRNIHESLSQFAYQLRTRSLHCINDVPPKTSEEEADTVIIQEDLNSLTEGLSLETRVPALPLRANTEPTQYHIGSNSALGLRGKVSRCARDLVAPCRKCGIVICRNCALKPPSARNFPNRHRRLCKTCLDAPLINHLQPLDESFEVHDNLPGSSASSTRSVRSFSSTSSHSDLGNELEHQQPSFTSPVFLRQPCGCLSQGVYLCQPCGQGLVAADTTYKRVWTWRSRYSTHIGGGLGTGLGLGNQGQKCGRGEHCLEKGAAGICWVEIECSESRAQPGGRDDGYGISRSSTPLASDHENDGVTLNRPGYLSQELEGIGGVLKKKVKKRVKVGATVYEYDDERETGKYLQRESKGLQRSWCGWCSRVCPGEKDHDAADRLLH